MTPREPSVMVAAVRKVLLQPGASLAQIDVLSAALVAAVLDHLPREAMAMRLYGHADQNALAVIDLLIAAARDAIR